MWKYVFHNPKMYEMYCGEAVFAPKRFLFQYNYSGSDSTSTDDVDHTICICVLRSKSSHSHCRRLGSDPKMATVFPAFLSVRVDYTVVAVAAPRITRAFFLVHALFAGHCRNLAQFNSICSNPSEI